MAGVYLPTARERRSVGSDVDRRAGLAALSFGQPGPGPASVDGQARVIQIMAFVSAAIMAQSGSVKQAVPFALPLDLTVLSTLTTLALGVLYCMVSGTWPAGRTLAMVGLLIAIAMSGAIHVAPTAGAEEKLERFVAVTVLAALATVLAVRTHRHAAEFVWTLAAVSLGLSVWIALTGQQLYGAGGRLTSQVGATISFGRSAGFVLVAVVAWLVTSQNLSLVKVAFAVALIGSQLWTMLAIGSRGPIQAFFFAMVVMVGMQARRMTALVAVQVLVTFAALSGLLYAVWDSVPVRARDRIVEIDGRSTNARQFAWDLTWERLDASPFGFGWGSWARQDDVAGLLYAHNFVLEVWYEAGVVALIALIAALWIAGRNQLRAMGVDGQSAAIVTGALVFWSAAAMVSGDVNDNKVLWIVLAVSAARVVGGDQQGDLEGYDAEPGPPASVGAAQAAESTASGRTAPIASITRST